ncbi:PIR Superfamily Protein [Plasmodium ovale wallikeri]|uniref:PIR Superfamily Protein n=1 Tax=Plasmodium ovale wallikeri TaxID=864142 RepID=A0A1A9AHI9_PLAOA|nr:PIR Superfamily Protein [Plasmodium ovale wallikeri]SBT56820.1 PIR Superfamily Protein [Plasmodium ovale wallikeri]
MSPEVNDPFFEKYEKDYPFLLELPLYAIYIQFHRNVMHGYQQHSSCDSQIKDENAHTNDIRQICKSVQTYLPQLKGMNDTFSLKDVSKTCEYLSYWIYDKIKYINNSPDNIKNLYNTINPTSTHGLSHECSNIKDFKIPADEFNKKKELFFHAENLYWIENKYSTIKNDDSTLYRKYLVKCAEYYNEIMRDNYCKGKGNYKSELTVFSTNFNKTKNFLNTNGIQIKIEDIKSPGIFECTPKEKSREGGPDAQLDGHLQNPYSGHPNDDVGTTDPVTIAGTSLGIFSVMFLSYLYLHKFRVYQNFIRPLLQKKMKMLNNIEDDDNEFLQIPEHDQMNLDNTSYRVNYHSAQDY